MTQIDKNRDPFGTAVREYHKFRFRLAKIRVFSNVSGNEKINPAYLFRNYEGMSELEQTALDRCQGAVLDIGACAGSHSLYLQNKGFEVCSLDFSPGCCDVMRARGLQDVVCQDIFTFNRGRFETVLMLMNGIGIAGSIKGLRELLQHLKSILTPGGQVLFDSSDIDYIYYEKDGSKWINLNSEYYGEVNYKLTYKKVVGKSFGWLFIDHQSIARVAEEEGFIFTKLADGNHNDYLGKLILK